MPKPSPNDPPPKPKAAQAGKDSEPHIHISVLSKEVDKPQGGGGHGQEAPYKATISIDGEPAFNLTASDFKFVGQMERFCRWVEERQSKEPMPKAPTRQPQRKQ